MAQGTLAILKLKGPGFAVSCPSPPLRGPEDGGGSSSSEGEGERWWNYPKPLSWSTSSAECSRLRSVWGSRDLSFRSHSSVDPCLYPDQDVLNGNLSFFSPFNALKSPFCWQSHSFGYFRPTHWRHFVLMLKITGFYITKCFTGF